MSGRWSLCHHLCLERAWDLSISELLTSPSNVEGRWSPSAPHHACVARETGESLWVSRPNSTRLFHGSRLTCVLEVAVSRLRPYSSTVLTQIEQLRLVSRIAGPLEVL